MQINSGDLRNALKMVCSSSASWLSTHDDEEQSSGDESNRNSKIDRVEFGENGKWHSNFRRMKPKW